MFLLLAVAGISIVACSDDDDNNDGGETGNARVIHVDEPGTLGAILGNERFTIEELIISGDLDYEDQYLLGELTMEGSLRIIDMTNATLENGILENEIFYDGRLESIKLPSSLVTIENNVFGECEKLRNVEFPATLTTVDYNAFTLCSGLQTFHFKSSEPISAENWGIDDYIGQITVYVPKGSKAAYEADDFWSQAKKIVEE